MPKIGNWLLTVFPIGAKIVSVFWNKKCYRPGQANSIKREIQPHALSLC